MLKSLAWRFTMPILSKGYFGPPWTPQKDVTGRSSCAKWWSSTRKPSSQLGTSQRLQSAKSEQTSTRNHSGTTMLDFWLFPRTWRRKCLSKIYVITSRLAFLPISAELLIKEWIFWPRFTMRLIFPHLSTSYSSRPYLLFQPRKYLKGHQTTAIIYWRIDMIRGWYVVFWALSLSAQSNFHLIE